MKDIRLPVLAAVLDAAVRRSLSYTLRHDLFCVDEQFYPDIVRLALHHGSAGQPETKAKATILVRACGAFVALSSAPAVGPTAGQARKFQCGSWAVLALRVW